MATNHMSKNNPAQHPAVIAVAEIHDARMLDDVPPGQKILTKGLWYASYTSKEECVLYAPGMLTRPQIAEAVAALLDCGQKPTQVKNTNEFHCRRSLALGVPA